jgi:hypothetical protein
MQVLGTKSPAGTLYRGINYFDDVVGEYAFPLTPNCSYLEYSWSAGATSSQQFEAIESTYTESSWTFDSSVYAGVSGGQSVEVFGLGEGFKASFLAGFSVAFRGTQTSTTGSGWGIGIPNNDWGPVTPPTYDPNNPTHTFGVSGYTFRVYFLPPPSLPPGPGILPPNYWAQELYYGLTNAGQTGAGGLLDPATIDLSSCPWKIMYVVTQITNNNGQNNYNYTNK